MQPVVHDRPLQRGYYEDDVSGQSSSVRPRPDCGWIEWISSVNKTGAADGEKSFYFTNRFGHHAVWLAGLKLALQLNKGVIGGIESVCQRCSNIKDRDRILRQKAGRVGYVKL